MEYNFTFESHSTSLDNEMGIASGLLDPSLSTTGESQARDLGIRYKNSDISIVYCSDLKRSLETALIAFKSKNIPIIKDPRLREWDYGDFNGYPAQQVDEMKMQYVNAPFPGGESLIDAALRVSSFLQTLPPKGRILIIGHRAVYYTLELLSSEITSEDLLSAHWKWQPGWKYNSINFSRIG